MAQATRELLETAPSNQLSFEASWDWWSIASGPSATTAALHAASRKRTSLQALLSKRSPATRHGGSKRRLRMRSPQPNARTCLRSPTARAHCTSGSLWVHVDANAHVVSIASAYQSETQVREHMRGQQGRLSRLARDESGARVRRARVSHGLLFG